MNLAGTRCIVLIAAVLLPVVLLPKSDAAQPIPVAYRWVNLPGNYLELEYDGRPVVRYVNETYDGSSRAAHEHTYKPFHLIYSPDGTVLLTKGEGGLYPHHRGLFYGFNQVTYGDDQQCDIWHCTEQTHQSHVETIATGALSELAYHVAAIDWHGADGEVFAHETRGLAIDVRLDGTQLDFISSLESADGQPIHLDGDPQHAGVHFRAAQEVADDTSGETYYLRTDGRGRLGETRNWEAGGDPAMNAQTENLPWNAMSFVVDGRRFTVLYLDHPTNPKPSRYSERDYGRFGSYFVADVTADRPLRIRYRLWIQEGEMTVDQCETMWERFVTSDRPIPDQPEELSRMAKDTPFLRGNPQCCPQRTVRHPCALLRRLFCGG